MTPESELLQVKDELYNVKLQVKELQRRCSFLERQNRDLQIMLEISQENTD